MVSISCLRLTDFPAENRTRPFTKRLNYTYLSKWKKDPYCTNILCLKNSYIMQNYNIQRNQNWFNIQLYSNKGSKIRWTHSVTKPCVELDIWLPRDPCGLETPRHITLAHPNSDTLLPGSPFPSLPSHWESVTVIPLAGHRFHKPRAAYHVAVCGARP